MGEKFVVYGQAYNAEGEFVSDFTGEVERPALAVIEAVTDGRFHVGGLAPKGSRGKGWKSHIYWIQEQPKSEGGTAT